MSAEGVRRGNAPLISQAKGQSKRGGAAPTNADVLLFRELPLMRKLLFLFFPFRRKVYPTEKSFSEGASYKGRGNYMNKMN